MASTTPKINCGQMPSTNISAMLGSTRNRSAVVRSGSLAQRSFSGPQNERWAKLPDLTTAERLLVLPSLFGEQPSLSSLDEAYEATTLGGLVSEIEGHIPLPGEVVLLESAGLRMEVVASTDRRVERLRVFPPSADASPTKPE